MDDRKNIIYALFIASFALASINYVLSAIYRRALFRFIPCCNKEGSPVVLTLMIRYFIIFMLTFAYSCLLFMEPKLTYIILHYRAFNRLFHAPYIASLESMILFLVMISNQDMTGISYFLVLFIIHIVLHRLMLLANKLLYVFVSIFTAYKNKKQ